MSEWTAAELLSRVTTGFVWLANVEGPFMEAKAELLREVDTEHEEEKVVEWGEVSEETKGGPVGLFLEFPCGGGRTNFPC